MKSLIKKGKIEAKRNDYGGFVDKFKSKKTTDDCMTPPEYYDCIRDWVDENIAPLAGRRIVRPFWPGADYTAFDYRPGCRARQSTLRYWPGFRISMSPGD